VNVYAVPVVKPETVIGLDAPDAVSPLGLDVTLNDVAAGPEADGVNVTDALVAETCVR
jgi:hypothetical protein